MYILYFFLLKDKLMRFTIVFGFALVLTKLKYKYILYNFFNLN